MNESNIKGVSIRSILAFMIVAACCAIDIYNKDAITLKDLAFLVLGFYFGQKPAPTSTPPTPAKGN